MGRVERVLPGMQAAFVDIGLERAAFLHVSDIGPRRLEPQSGTGTEPPPEPRIDELIRGGQRLLVQVLKDPLGSKGARLTAQLSIPSRYLVLLPEMPGIGVSVRIEEDEERERLRELVAELTGPDAQHGYIVRTKAEGVDAAALARDLKYLRRMWPRIKADAAAARSVQLVHEGLSLPYRSLRDLMDADIEKVRIDDRHTRQQAVRFAGEFFPEWADRIELYDGDSPLFDLYGVEDEIRRALKRSVALKSGGYVVIDQTEAMATIDVNTGSYLGHRNLEETIYKTNLEAAQAVARQLRLRNLGGIIIIDFIDMVDPEHRRQVLRTLEKSLARDHAKTTVYDFSPLGLVEMTRKRTVESLQRQLSEPCAACGGRGMLKTAETVTYEVFREITRAVRQFDAEQLLVIASPPVVTRITDEESAAVAELEEFLGKSIRFQADEQYPQEQFDVVLL